MNNTEQVRYKWFRRTIGRWLANHRKTRRHDAKSDCWTGVSVWHGGRFGNWVVCYHDKRREMFWLGVWDENKQRTANNK